jgi:hypothetical protein
MHCQSNAVPSSGDTDKVGIGRAGYNRRPSLVQSLYPEILLEKSKYYLLEIWVLFKFKRK